jgi:hypothetical protein
VSVHSANGKQWKAYGCVDGRIKQFDRQGIQAAIANSNFWYQYMLMDRKMETTACIELLSLLNAM